MAKKIKKPDLSKIKSKLKGKVYVGDYHEQLRQEIDSLSKEKDSLSKEKDSLRKKMESQSKTIDSLKQVIKVRIK